MNSLELVEEEPTGSIGSMGSAALSLGPSTGLREGSKGSAGSQWKVVISRKRTSLRTTRSSEDAASGL